MMLKKKKSVTLKMQDSKKKETQKNNTNIQSAIVQLKDNHVLLMKTLEDFNKSIIKKHQECGN